MPEYRRTKIAGGIYFFTVTTHRRQPILIDEDVRAALRAGIDKTRERFPFVIDAWVLLPDHLHCIWTLPEGDADYAKRWGTIKRHVSQQCKQRFLLGNDARPSQHQRNELALWQRRYWEHQIRDEVDYERHVDYIHWNPVKHGLTQDAAHWPYSTFHQYVTRGIYPRDWGGRTSNPVNDKQCGE